MATAEQKTERMIQLLTATRDLIDEAIEFAKQGDMESALISLDVEEYLAGARKTMKALKSQAAK